MKVSLCDVSGLIKTMVDMLAGKDGDEWAEALKRFQRRENPWTMAPIPDDLPMALYQLPGQQFGDGVQLIEAYPEAIPVERYYKTETYLRHNLSKFSPSWRHVKFFIKDSVHRAGVNVYVSYISWHNGEWVVSERNWADTIGPNDYLVEIHGVYD